MPSPLIYILVQHNCTAKPRMPVLYLLDIRWLVMVLKRKTSACHGTTARSMQPAVLSLTATLLLRTRNRWPWLRAKVGHLCLLPLTRNVVAQGGSRKGHSVALILQVLTLFHAVDRVDKACQVQGVILQSLCKPCNIEQHKHWLMCVACMPFAQANSSSCFVSCLCPVCPSSSS